MIGADHLKKLLKVISGLLCLALEVVLSSGNELLVRVICPFIVVTLIVASSDCDSLGSLLWPLLFPMALLFAPLPAALSGTPQLPLGAAFPLP
jgi:hypothetical protein